MKNSIDTGGAAPESNPRTYQTARRGLVFEGEIRLYRMELLGKGAGELCRKCIIYNLAKFNEGFYRLENSKSRGYGKVEAFVVDQIGVEMIRANVGLKGTFNLDDRDSANALLTAANQSTIIKVKQMKQNLSELAEREYNEELLKKLRQAIDHLSSLISDKHVFLIGGYKGLLHSIKLNDFSAEIAGAVFLDPETMLPHGLVRIELQ